MNCKYLLHPQFCFVWLNCKNWIQPLNVLSRPPNHHLKLAAAAVVGFAAAVVGGTVAAAAAAAAAAARSSEEKKSKKLLQLVLFFQTALKDFFKHSTDSLALEFSKNRKSFV